MSERLEWTRMDSEAFTVRGRRGGPKGERKVTSLPFDESDRECMSHELCLVHPILSRLTECRQGGRDAQTTISSGVT